MSVHKYSRFVFILLLVLSATPLFSAPVALLSGVLFAILFGNPYLARTQKITHKLLQYSVIGLGFGMNAVTALQAGKSGFFYTLGGIVFTFTVGIIISKLFKVDYKTSYLISAGTAICGGSAIAAVAPVIDAKSENTSVALGVVFILNSIALLVFPVIGHSFNLTEPQFGLWSAIAIHDTSSVVGAASVYGANALAVAATIKLARALWIIPVTIISGLIFNSGLKKVKIPYFIIAFFLAMLVNTWLPLPFNAGHYIFAAAKQALVVTLFLIGSNLSKSAIKSVGFKPFLLGIALWVMVSAISLLLI